jgi:thiamine-monophosphate kinase
MKELDFLKVIKETLTDSHYIENDCADLKDIGLFITQDTLVEGVHFDLKTTTPYKLGQKAIAVNISDLATTICNPAYISIGLSIPNSISEEFVREFYRGINDACLKYNTVVTGGDITGADKVFISVTAIGRRRHEINISRSYAHVGDFIITTGNYGASAAGLAALQNGWSVSDEILNAHLMPEARLFEAHEAGKHIENDLAIMDTSDGLADALYKVAKASNVSINVNFDDIPVLDEVKNLAKEKNVDLKDWVLWGGEDFELVFFVPYFLFAMLSSKGFKYIGTVTEKLSDDSTVTIIEKDKKLIIDEKMFNEKIFNHFGG